MHDGNLFHISTFPQIETKLTDGKLKRLSIDLTEQEHRVLKGHALKVGVSMRDLVLQVLRQEGLLGRSKRRPQRLS